MDFLYSLQNTVSLQFTTKSILKYLEEVYQGNPDKDASSQTMPSFDYIAEFSIMTTIDRSNWGNSSNRVVRHQGLALYVRYSGKTRCCGGMGYLRSLTVHLVCKTMHHAGTSKRIG